MIPVQKGIEFTLPLQESTSVYGISWIDRELYLNRGGCQYSTRLSVGCTLTALCCSGVDQGLYFKYGGCQFSTRLSVRCTLTALCAASDNSCISLSFAQQGTHQGFGNGTCENSGRSEFKCSLALAVGAVDRMQSAVCFCFLYCFFLRERVPLKIENIMNKL